MIQIGTKHKTLSLLPHTYYLLGINWQYKVNKSPYEKYFEGILYQMSHLWVACSESLDQNTTSLQDHRAACYSDMIFFSRLFNPRSQSSYKALNLWYMAFEDYCIESRPGQRIYIGRVFIGKQVGRQSFLGFFWGGSIIGVWYS